MGELNLIPYVLKEKKSKNVMLKKTLAFSIIILAILFASLYAPKMFLNSLKDKQQELRAEISKGDAILAENVKLKEEVTNLKGYTDKVDVILKSKDAITDKVRGIEKFIKADVSLDSIEYVANSITMTGRTKNYFSISEFGANLQMSKEYTQSYITNVSLEAQTGDYVFTIHATYNGGAVK